MMSLLTIVGIALLGIEGFFCAQWILLTRERALPALLALPLASLTNVLVFFLFTITGIPLNFLSLTLAHVLLIGFTFWKVRSLSSGTTIAASAPLLTLPLWARWICAILLAVSLVFGAVHALLLPSLHIDVFTNWAMRSQISFLDEHMAFDLTEARGMAKPQYPFLLHGLQIMGNIGQHTWNDRATNIMTWLMTMSALGAMFLLLARRHGRDAALLVTTILVQLPLVGIHLSQGYADFPLMLYCLLSWLALYEHAMTKEKKWMVLSVLFLGAALWTKSEGLFVAFVPWACTLVLLRSTMEWSWKQTLGWITAGIALYAPFIVFLLVKGLHLTPHESDGSLGIKWEGFAALPHGLFGAASFGPFWMAIALSALALLKKHAQKKEMMVWGAWALLSFAVVLFTYLFTPNVGFFLNGQSFYRQLFVPAGLLVFWVLLLWKHRSVPPPP